MEVLQISVSLFFVVFTLWFIWRKRKMSYFERLGIPGPKPNFFSGNLTELNKKGPAVCQKEWTQKYGKFLGYYVGASPILLVADPELVKYIEIKNFSSFANRGSFIVPPKFLFKSPQTNSLIEMKGERWKEIRTILTPTFSSSKMKQMMPLMEDSVNQLMENINEKSKDGQPFDIYELYQRLTIDIISKAAFGIKTDVQKNPEALFFRTAKSLFENAFDKIRVLIKLYFPEINAIADFIIIAHDQKEKIRGRPSLRGLLSSISKVITFRRENQSAHRQDMLQLMIDANMSLKEMKSVSNDKLTVAEQPENESVINTESDSKGQKRYMNDDEIIANAALFLLAGYETTSTALGFTTHLLSVHQDVQEKLRNEIKEVIKAEGKLDYNNVFQMKYLDQVFSESLRIYSPSLTFIRRTANADIQYKNFRIPKGIAIQIAIWSLHHDPEYWPEPEKFLPERFSSANKSKIHPMTYQPFGSGPRNCIGMRFAQLEAKLAIANIISTYKLVPEREAKQEIEVAYSVNTSHPKHGVRVKAIPA